MARQRTKKPDPTAAEAEAAAADAHYAALAEQQAEPSFNPAELERPTEGRQIEQHTFARREHSKRTVQAGGVLVKLIDKADNEAGIGIRIDFPEGSKGRPTDEEKAIIRRVVRGDPGQESGFEWKRDLGMWLKQIVRDGEDPRDVPPTRAVAIRLDAERRVERLADELRHHAADPAGYADRVRQEREQEAGGPGIPD